MKLTVFTLLIITALSGSAQQRFPVTQQQVSHALLRRGVNVDVQQISLVASIVASKPDPELDIDSIQPFGDGREGQSIQSKVRVVCSKAGSCLPFYAIVTWPPGTSLSALASMDRAASFKSETPTISMRVGSNATLIVDTGQMRLRVPVISLQNGAIGSTIRVTSLDRKQTYNAVVVSPTLLTGSL